MPHDVVAPRPPNYHKHYHHHYRGAPYQIPRLRCKQDAGPVSKSKPRPLPPHNNQRVGIVNNSPAYNFILPVGGPLNFTLVEIISILPNWFRNRDIATRFQNNRISASLHFLILDEHRHLDLATDIERHRFRERIAYAYRSTMRSTNPLWTKHSHRSRTDFDKNSLLVNDIVPDAARTEKYTAPSAIPFEDLAIGLKKLPQGDDAGDLTRALEFALDNQHAFIFPEDLQVILNWSGRTQICSSHTDAHAIARYEKVLRAAQLLQSRKNADLRKQQQDAEFRHETQLVAQQGRYPLLQLDSHFQEVATAQDQHVQSDGGRGLTCNQHQGTIFPSCFSESDKYLLYHDVPHAQSHSQGAAALTAQLLDEEHIAELIAQHAQNPTVEPDVLPSSPPQGFHAGEPVAQHPFLYADDFFPPIPDVCCLLNGEQEDVHIGTTDSAWVVPYREALDVDAGVFGGLE